MYLKRHKLQGSQVKYRVLLSYTGPTPSLKLTNQIVTPFPQERMEWGSRDRTECDVNGMSLHVEGNFRSGGEVNLLIRLEVPEGRQRWSFILACIPPENPA